MPWRVTVQGTEDGVSVHAERKFDTFAVAWNHLLDTLNTPGEPSKDGGFIMEIKIEHVEGD